MEGGREKRGREGRREEGGKEEGRKGGREDGGREEGRKEERALPITKRLRPACSFLSHLLFSEMKRLDWTLRSFFSAWELCAKHRGNGLH